MGIRMLILLCLMGAVKSGDYMHYYSNYMLSESLDSMTMSEVMPSSDEFSSESIEPTETFQSMAATFMSESDDSESEVMTLAMSESADGESEVMTLAVSFSLSDVPTDSERTIAPTSTAEALATSESTQTTGTTEPTESESETIDVSDVSESEEMMFTQTYATESTTSSTTETEPIDPTETTDIDMTESDIEETELFTLSAEVSESEEMSFTSSSSTPAIESSVAEMPTETVTTSSELINPTASVDVSTSTPPIENGELYPYGDDQGDASFGSTWPQISNTIFFANKVPYGGDGYSIAHVLYNGIITFGPYRFAYYPNLGYAFSRFRLVAAPFWAYFDWYDEDARVYYHLYERDGVSSDADEEARKAEILIRATGDVRDFDSDTFNASSVLVATWDNVRPANWYSWICKYYYYLAGYDWFDYIYQYYCVDDQDPELNTFQAVYVTDGETAYLLYLYKNGGMTWRFDRWRRIVIGYANGDELFEFDGLTYTAASTTLDVDVGNTGVAGYYIYEVGKIENPVKRCRNFVLDNLYLLFSVNYYAEIASLYQCPCTRDRLQRHWWWLDYEIDYTTGEEIHCYALSTVAKSRLARLFGVSLNKMCCYRFTPPYSYFWWDWFLAWRRSTFVAYGPRAGRILGNDPWYWQASSRLYITEDVRPHKWCCIDSNIKSRTCTAFHTIRPLAGCTQNVVIINARLLGDPHVRTLDGRLYTMNGWGEYILMEVKSEEFVLQGRTERAVGSNGNFTQATVFVAFAAEETENATFQAELNSTKDGMILLANGIDITLSFYGNDTFDAIYDDTVSVTKTTAGDRVTAEVTFESGITLKMYPGNQNLEFSVSVPEEFRTLTTGMMGNFNNDTTDEFITADGTDLGDSLTERQIFENFASTWQVTSLTSVFTYPTGMTAVDFQHADFEPLFREEANQTLLALAEDFCGADNVTCVFDYLATGDEDFASATLQTDQDNQAEDESLANIAPTVALSDGQLNSDGYFMVDNGETYYIMVNGSDANGDAFTFELVPHDAGTDLTVNDSGVITYFANTSFPVSIEVYTEDSKGAISEVIAIPISGCTGCSNNGDCDSSVTRDEEFLDGNFILLVCNCGPAWTGDDCDLDFDACADNDSPCLDLQNCTDLTPAEQGNSTVGHECGDCPTGYEVMEQVAACVDINECNGTDPCTNADCVNAVGSFTCECQAGYRETNDDNVCEDVDECIERSHNCAQVCTNTEGNFNCSCFEGYSLNNAGVCEQDSDLQSLCASKGCSHLCINDSGAPACICPSGYDLIPGNDTHCENVNECDVGVSPCQHICVDEIGSYTCSCRDGFQLAADNQNCEECEPPYWGTNCQSRCACSGRGTCDSQRGCMCRDGWTGENCNTDVDECTEDPNACKTDQTCENTRGNFTCTCIAGYLINDGGDCEDIDECEDVTTHDCDPGVEECVNNQGSFRCDCQNGFARDGSGDCVDVDECAQGIDSCEQICDNVNGFYNCRCEFGYRLLSDRESCEQSDDVCRDFNLTCQYQCTVDTSSSTAFCICPRGFGLVGETDCEDINECELDHLNLCDEPYLCQNTNGSYTCSCSAGFRLDNDGRTCTACTGGTWGTECQNSCGCTENIVECSTRIGCICETGYTGTLCDEDIDECLTGSVRCEATQVCENIPGTARCVCGDGYVAVDNTTCEDVNECESSSNNDCSQECTNTPGSFVCSCYDGYQEANDGSCEDVDECALGLNNCEQDCVNLDGRFRCDCASGFDLGPDGASCSVSADCDDPSVCQEICAVVDGVATCFCPLGKELNTADNATCLDVDLCQGAPCIQNCRENDDNTIIECYCNVGNQLDSDGFSCSECPDGKFGDECSQNCTCLPLNTELCNKTDGSCSCNTGWMGDDCSTDINECLSGTDDCLENSTCTNTDGSFVCICNDGFFKSGDDCIVCPENKYGKDCASSCLCDRGDCNHVDGSCDCDDGWEGVICDTDIDECVTETDDCDLDNRTNWVCFNIPGAYDCGCADGYLDNGVNCTDIDECSADHLNQCDHLCTNTDGSYVCSCNAGYTLQGNFTCVDTDECATLSPCDQVCVNQDGSFACSCDLGHSLEDDNATCFVSFEYVFTITLNTTLSFIIDPANPLYDALVADLEAQVTAVLSGMVDSFVRYFIIIVRLGSVIIDGTSIVRDIGNHRGTMVEALIALATTDITVENKNVTPVITYNGTQLNITADTDRCELVQLLNPCPSGTTCILSAGVATCQGDDDDDDLNIPLIVGLSVGIPLLVIVIALIVAVCYLKSKNKKLTRVASREGHYNDNISRPPSGGSGGGLLLNQDK